MRPRDLLPNRLKSEIKRLYIARKYGVVLHRNVRVSLETRFEGRSVVGEGCVIYDSVIGLGTYLAAKSDLSYAKIGRFCSLGGNIRVCIGNHPSTGFVSTHPCFFSTYGQAGFTFVEKTCFAEHRFLEPEGKYVTEVGNDVWIGDDVVILDGVRIGDGAIIGLRSVVTRDIEPYTVCAGIPAKRIRDRFSEEQKRFLLEFRWWEKGWEWIRDNSIYFDNIETFYGRFQTYKNRGM